MLKHSATVGMIAMSGFRRTATENLKRVKPIDDIPNTNDIYEVDFRSKSSKMADNIMISVKESSLNP